MHVLKLAVVSETMARKLTGDCLKVLNSNNRFFYNVNLLYSTEEK